MVGVSFAGCAGWLHEANGSRCVIMCSALGFEELSARRSWRVLAEKFAAAGMPTLRFDYHGTADSDGSSDQPGRVAAWRASIREAVGWMERELGVSEIVLVGLRAGALLAALEAEQHDRIAALALLAPVLNGADYTRELEDVARQTSPPAIHSVEWEEGPVLDICGFRDNSETVADIGKLTLASLARAPAPKILVLAADGDVRSKICGFMRKLGSDVEDGEGASFEPIIRDPGARIPEADFDCVVGWAAALGPMREVPRPRVRSQDLHGGLWVEARVRFGPARTLAGVLCQPQCGRATEPLIFIDGGMSYHIGWARMTVAHARSLAAAGVPSLRIDCAGIGDSGFLFAPNERVLYGRAAAASLTSAVDWMEAHGYERPTVLGIGSGAYTAFHGIRSDPRIGRAIFVNLPCFWSPPADCDFESGPFIPCAGPGRGTAAAEVQTARKRAGSTAGKLAVRCFHNAKRAVKAAVFQSRKQGSRTAGQVVRGWFEDLSERGCELMFLYSALGPGLAEFERWTGPIVLSLPGVSLHVIENAGRNFANATAQSALLEHVSNFLGLREMPHFGSQMASGLSASFVPTSAPDALDYRRA